MRTADLVLPFRPMSKPRPRVSVGRARPYMDTVYVEWKKGVRAVMGEWWTHPPLTKINCLIFSFKGPARGDLDNRVGAVLDAGNGLVWKDDSVSIIPAIAARWSKASIKEARIYIKIICEES